MVSNLERSDSLTWLARAAQARRIAGMLSPSNARLAEAYAAECDYQARRPSTEGIRTFVMDGARHGGAMKPTRRKSPKQAA